MRIMKLKFVWVSSPEGMQATCIRERASLNEVCPLSSLLTDDGGLDLNTSLAWLREGILRVNAALSGKGDVDWDRDAWGAAVTEVETRVYSLHDDQCAETFPTLKFRQALVEWTKFIEAGSATNIVTVDLGQCER